MMLFRPKIRDYVELWVVEVGYERAGEVKVWMVTRNVEASENVEAFQEQLS